MKYVKTWQDGDYQFYFENDNGQQCSPTFGDTSSAQQWRNLRHSNSYSGIEHRHSPSDRRRLIQGHKPTQEARDNAVGRRMSDQPLYLDIDRSAAPLAEAYHRYTDFYV